jgi:hypothetical protein
MLYVCMCVLELRIIITRKRLSYSGMHNKNEGTYRCCPLQSKHNRIPNETDAQSGFGVEQSTHTLLPGKTLIDRTSSRVNIA